LFKSQKIATYVLFAILAITNRFSRDAYYQQQHAVAAERYASEAWRTIVRQYFDGDEAPNCRMVQAITLLALYDFVG
jgi:hypothetical protein